MRSSTNIEIWNDGKVLAASYFHLQGSTERACELTDAAVVYINRNDCGKNMMLYAVRVLESVGAAFDCKEIRNAAENADLCGYAFNKPDEMTQGAIAITKGCIEAARSLAESTVRIYLDEKRLSFHALNERHELDFVKDARMLGLYVAKPLSLAVIDLNLDDIKFDEWGKAAEILTRQKTPWITRENRWVVLTPKA